MLAVFLHPTHSFPFLFHSVLKEGRGALNTFAKENELAELRSELQEGLTEVNRIRGEWKDLSNPSSMTNVLFDNDGAYNSANTTSSSSSANATPGGNEARDARGTEAAANSADFQGDQQLSQPYQEEEVAQVAPPPQGMRAAPPPPPPVSPAAVGGGMAYGVGASFVAASIASRRAAAKLRATPEHAPQTAPPTRPATSNKNDNDNH